MGNLDHTIAALVSDAGPVIPALPPWRRLGEWCLVTGAIMAVYLFAVPLRPDLAEKTGSSLFMGEVGCLAALMLAVAAAAVWLCYPDLRQRTWVLYLPSVPLAGFIGLCLYRGLHPETVALPLPEDEFEINCAGCITMLAVVPGLAMFRIVRQHATVRPVLAGAMALLASACIGLILLKFAEQNDSIAHLLISHIVPVMILTAMGGWLGRKFLRW